MMKKFTKHPVTASKKSIKAPDTRWVGLLDEPGCYGSIAYDVFYNDENKEIGKVKSTQIEEYAASPRNPRKEVAVKRMKEYIKKIFKM